MVYSVRFYNGVREVSLVFYTKKAAQKFFDFQTKYYKEPVSMSYTEEHLSRECRA